MTKPPEQVPGVLVVFEDVFDEEKLTAWVIETEQGNPDKRIDSVYYGALHHLTSYSFFLEFKKDGQNGDYYIYAGDGEGENVITELDLWSKTDDCDNIIYYYNYKFNGFLESHKTKRVVIYKSQI